MKVLVIGATGMLGHMVNQYLEEQGHQVFGTTRKRDSLLYYDAVKDIEKIEKIIDVYEVEAVINCIGILNAQAENDKTLAIKLNSYLPHYLDKISKNKKIKFIHISTDCVFEGTKGSYTEASLPDATSFYGKTKALGEISDSENVTLRTSIIGPDLNVNGIGLFNWFMSQHTNDEITGFSEVVWTGVTTLQLAKVIEFVMMNDLKGLYNVVNGESISKFDLLVLFNKIFERNISIKKDCKYKSNKSLISIKKESNLGIPSYEKMLEEMKEWVILHQDQYPNYYEVNV